MEDHYYREMAAIQKEHWWYEGRRKILSALIERLLLPQKPAILEIGCGTGANLKILQRFGAVCGIEPHDFARTYAHDISGCDIQKGFLPDDIPFERNFDLIGAFDVIEHVEDDSGSLKAMREKLSEDGFAVFTVPAFQWLWSTHDEINHHKRRYTKKQFLSLLKHAGYKIDFISYYNMWAFPPAILVRLLKRCKTKGTYTSDAKSVRYGFINKILLTIFASERFLLRSYIPLPIGLSIIAVCRKA